MHSVEVGDRVRVRINQDLHRWSAGAVKSMNGKAGVVEEVRGPDVLVRFDTPAETWWTDQSPVRSFHFGLQDLEEDGREEELNWSAVEDAMRSSVTGRGLTDVQTVLVRKAFQADRTRYSELSARVREEEQELLRRAFAGDPP